MSVGPSFSQYLRKVIEDVREEERYVPVEVWTITKSGVSSDDAFAVPISMSSGSAFFSGAIAWSRTVQKEDSAGGYFTRADVTIVAHKDNRGSVDGENKYLIVEGISVRPSRIIDITETNEIILYCDKYQP